MDAVLILPKYISSKLDVIMVGWDLTVENVSNYQDVKMDIVLTGLTPAFVKMDGKGFYVINLIVGKYFASTVKSLQLKSRPYGFFSAPGTPMQNRVTEICKYRTRAIITRS